jgi:hypothetical protein
VRKTVNYVVVLEDGVRKRHTHEMFRGEIVRFAVQLEVLNNGRWQPVVRYDNAHSFSHRDVYNIKCQVKKEALDLSMNAAMTYGDWDINHNWEVYINRYRRGE